MAPTSPRTATQNIDLLPLHAAVMDWNVPGVLEQNDLRHFTETAGTARLVKDDCAMFEKAAKRLAGCGLKRPISPQGSTCHYRLAEQAVTAERLVMQLSGRPDILEQTDVQGLAKIFDATTAERLGRELTAARARVVEGLPRLIVETKKFATDPKFRTLRDQVDTVVSKTWEELNRQFGWSLLLPPLPAGAVWLYDGTPATLQPAPSGTWLPPSDAEFVPGPLSAVYYTTERLLRTGFTGLQHEIQHLWLHTFLGPERYRALPRWFREGLATVAAGEVTSRSVALLSHTPQAITHAWRGAEFANGDSLPRDYFGAGLAVQFLIDRHGIAGIAKVLKEIKGGASFEIALGRGLPGWQNGTTFYRELESAVEKAITRFDVPQAREVYIAHISASIPDARARFSGEKDGAVVGALAEHIAKTPRNKFAYLQKEARWWMEFLTRYDTSIYTVAAHHFLGAIFARLDMRDESIKHYREVLRRSPTFTFADHAFFLAESQAAPPGAAGIPHIERAAQRTSTPAVRQWAYDEVTRRRAGRQ